jgi:hypothetical protein
LQPDHCRNCEGERAVGSFDHKIEFKATASASVKNAAMAYPLSAKNW